MVWTSDTRITMLINFALIVDAGKHFKFDEKSLENFKAVIKESNCDEEKIIEKSIKFMRLLNSYIVDKGTSHNTEKRVTYRGIDEAVMEGAKVGKNYRIISWLSTSKNTKTADKFQHQSGSKSGTKLKFNIEKCCYNAGKINKFGKSDYPSEEETLIPPYSAVYVRKHEGNFFELDLAQDNKSVDF